MNFGMDAVFMLTAPQELLELGSAQDSLEVDWSNGVIKGVRLHAQNSKNGYSYSEKSMKSLLELYKQTGLYVNHKQDGVDKLFGHPDPESLSMKREAGQLVIRGNAHMNVKHALYEKIMDDAENRPHLLRFSHEVPKGKFDFDDDQVQDVYEVRKISLIDTVGGVNKGIFEGRSGDSGAPDMTVTLKDLESNQPELIESIQNKALENCDCQKPDGAVAQCCELLKQVDELQEAANESAAKIADLEDQLSAIDRRKSLKDLAAEKNRKLTDGMLEMFLNIKGEDADKRIETLMEDLPELNAEPDPDQTKYRSNNHQNKGTSGARRNRYANL